MITWLSVFVLISEPDWIQDFAKKQGIDEKAKQLKVCDWSYKELGWEIKINGNTSVRCYLKNKIYLY